MSDDQRSEGADITAGEVLEGADALLEGRLDDPAAHKLLGAADILGADDIKTERVHVPEWGGDVLIRTLSGRERDAFESAMIMVKAGGKSRDVNLENFRSKLVAASLVDEAGNKLFSQKQVDQLAAKSSSALQRCFKVAQKLSGFGDDDVEELTAEMGKDQSSDSGTGSLLT